MTQKELLEAVARLVKRQVEKEVEKRMTAMRLEVISEVAGMLNYSERKLLTQLNEMKSQRPQRGYTETPDYSGAGGDFERSMRNLRTMPAFDHITETVEAPRRPEKKFTGDTLLNSILNETNGFTKDELMGDGDSGMGSLLDFGGQVEEPWATTGYDFDPSSAQDDFGMADEFDEFAPRSFNTPTPSSMNLMNFGPQPHTIMGTDMKPVDVNNPTVQKVLSIMNGTNHKEKLDKLNEAGDQFRGTGVTAPRYSSEYFEKAGVE